MPDQDADAGQGDAAPRFSRRFALLTAVALGSAIVAASAFAAVALVGGARVTAAEGFGVPFDVSPDSAAAVALEDPGRLLDDHEKQLIAVLASQPTATWVTGPTSSVEERVRSTVSGAAARGAISTIVAYNLPYRDCGGYSASGEGTDAAAYREWLDALLAGLGSERAIIVLEPDALAQVDCLDEAQTVERFQLVEEAVTRLSEQGSYVYIDAGHSAWVKADVMAGRLEQAGVEKAEGFSLNVANFRSTEDQIAYGRAVAGMLPGDPHVVIDTSRNGWPSDSGEWCNPWDRALGTPPTTRTGDEFVDALLWIKTPGRSDGECNGGPAAGVWWTDYALMLAENAEWVDEQLAEPVATFAPGTPRIQPLDGTPQVGEELVAEAGEWTPAPDGLAYQWLRGGADIAGASQRSYTPVPEDAGQELAVRVTATREGYVPGEAVSLPVVISESAAQEDPPAPEPAPPAAPVVDLPDRIAGADRYATAAEIAEVWDASFNASIVFVATGENYPDALAASAAAVHLGAPVLLTMKSSLPTVVKNRLHVLRPDRIVVLGSSASISSKVVSQLKAVSGSPEVVRWAGPDRYATMREVVKRSWGVDADGDGAENVILPSVVIATGRNYPDALSAGAAVGANGGAVILVDGSEGSVPSATLQLLKDLEPREIVIAGSTASVKSGIESQLKRTFGSGTVKRIAGADRYQTAARITDHYFDRARSALFAVGTKFPDALAGAALAGAVDAPLLIASKSCVSGSTRSVVNALGASDRALLGSSSSISASVLKLRTC